VKHITILDVPCTYCGQPVGNKCIYSPGKKIPEYHSHASRMKFFRTVKNYCKVLQKL